MTNTYAPIGFPSLQFEDNDGAPLALGKVYTYASDGVTPKLTYQYPNGTANTNPVNLDAYGRGVFWGDGDYIFTVKDADDVQLYSKAIATPNAQLGISTAMFPVVQASTTAEALSLLGGIGLSDIPTIIPVGSGLLWFSTTVPSGWLACYGQAVSRTTYSALFALWGTTFGAGDGSTTFNMPDLRSRFPLGIENPAAGLSGRVSAAVTGITPTAVGNVGGSQYIGAHTHSITDPGHLHTGVGVNLATATYAQPSSLAPALLFNQYTYMTTTTISSATTGITATGTNATAGAAANIPPAFVINFIVYTGV